MDEQLAVDGNSGAVLLRGRVIALFKSWQKTGRTVKFTVDPASINEFWANYGPASEVALHFRTKSCIYPVEPGDFRAGALQIMAGQDGKSHPPRVEPR